MNLFAKEYGIVKYVCVNGEYRFVDSMGNHKNLVKGGETASSAGFVYYVRGKFEISHERSMTLKYLGPDFDKDGPAIAAIIKMEYTGIQEF